MRDQMPLRDARPRWLARFLELQEELNCLSSVAIELPSLRPRAEALRNLLDGDLTRRTEDERV